MSADLRRIVPSLTERPDPRGSDFVLPVDDPADRTPAAVWGAALLGLGSLAAVAWWLLR